MLRFQTRVMMFSFITVDLLVTAMAWILAYVLRFHVGVVQVFLPVTKGVPDASRYLLLLPLMAVVWPAVLYFHGLYRIKRGRSLIDEFFAFFHVVENISVQDHVSTVNPEFRIGHWTKLSDNAVISSRQMMK